METIDSVFECVCVWVRRDRPRTWITHTDTPREKARTVAVCQQRRAHIHTVWRVQTKHQRKECGERKGIWVGSNYQLAEKTVGKEHTNTPKHLQSTCSVQTSSMYLSGSLGLYARHCSRTPLSSIVGISVIELSVLLVSKNSLKRNDK